MTPYLITLFFIVVSFAVASHSALANDTQRAFTVHRNPGYALSGTLFEVPGETPDTPELSIGIQNVVQTGMPSYSELITVFIRSNGAAVWRDLGEPFEQGNFVWLTALDNQLIAIDRQEVAPPRKLTIEKGPHWQPLTPAELDRLEGALGRGRSVLRRPRMKGGPFTIQVVQAGTLEICVAKPVPGKSCWRQALPPGNDIVYSIADHDEHVVLFANGGWFRLESDGTLRLAWLPNEEPRRSNQVYTAMRTNRGVLLGHYPSGNLLKMVVSNGRISANPIFRTPPHTAPARHSDRELQSLAHYGGHLLAGVWPWGELYEFNAASGWKMVRRVFQAPEISDTLAPYADAIMAANDRALGGRLFNRLYSLLPGWADSRRANGQAGSAVLDADVWGQRITQLVPLGASLYIATGNKSGEHTAKWLKFLPSPATAADYGRVYEMTYPGNLACTLPRGEEQLSLSIVVTRRRLEVRLGQKLICSLADRTVTSAGRLLAQPGIIGDGVYGRFTGGSISLVRPTGKELPTKASRPGSAELQKRHGHALSHARLLNVQRTLQWSARAEHGAANRNKHEQR